MIQLVADFLLSLYQAGWEPMTPIDMGLKKSETGSGPQTAICFRRKFDAEDREVFGSSYSLLSQMGASKDGDNTCLCLETFKDNYLGFHDVSNTVLYELVDTVQQEWAPGLRGVSMAVSSVICDYTSAMPAVLPGHPDVQDAKYIQLEGTPWSGEEGRELDDVMKAERLQISIIACLTREGYKLSMAINMDTSSKVYFFIKDKEESKGEVRIPNMAGAGLGEKDTLSVYRPMVVRSRSSFFRAYNGKTASIRRKVRASLRKKTVTKVSKQNTAMSYKPQLSEPAWWQQTSTDVSSDHEDV